MPASQLKRLKASLREQGITGPQKSKKQKKAQAKSTNDRTQRSAALQQIRDSFNPFELKAVSARPEKFSSVSHKNAASSGGSGRYRDILHRPGVSKSAGEEMRRATLLPELQRRNKVGGVVDRRIGEGDTDMTPEERAIQRFAREKERKKKGTSLFDLDASDDDQFGNALSLTHGGKSLNDLAADDFGDGASLQSDADEEEDLFTRKRRRPDEDEVVEDDLDEAEDAPQQPERKKTKKEVMEEVIAKSKLHKYERQKAKEDDDDLRDELDQGMGELKSLLFGLKQPVRTKPEADLGAGPTVNPERQKLLNGADRNQVDRDYDTRLKQLAQDARAKPSERSLTAEEKAAAESKRLQELEDKRLKRMRGETLPEDGIHADADDRAEGDDEIPDQAVEFGFTSSAAAEMEENPTKLVLDDEDEFALDDDLIASGSDAGLDDLESIESESGSDLDEEQEVGSDEEDEFISGILGPDVAASAKTIQPAAQTDSGLAFTYPCPQTHAEFVEIIRELPAEQTITIIQRIRALYHPSLSASNKESMANFSHVLVDHLAYMAAEKQPQAVTEQVIRHLHSLSRTYPTQIGNAFRAHLAAFSQRGEPTSGDLVLLAAIASIYPTSDHWHQVVTPAMTLIAKWLALHTPSKAQAVSAHNSAVGAYLTSLSLRYQRLSKRLVPEALRFTKRVLSAKTVTDSEVHLANVSPMAELWKSSSSFGPMFSPFLPVLKQIGTKSAKSIYQTLSILLSQARLSRRPLELHHHKPQPIRSSIPKFEENFNPDKHYDPDKDRSDARKLQREVKRERKGALRELRKDANFVAREQLREKRQRDEEYEKKYRKLVASVQAEEGAGKREWEREKAARKRKQR